jgi:hypothetical protein
MARQHWPTVEEVMADAERGLLDETTIRVRPSPEGREARRAAAEASLAARRGKPERPQVPTQRPA